MTTQKTLATKLLSREYHNLHRTSVDWFVADSARLVPEGAIVVDAGAGEGMYRNLFSHARYLGFDYAIGEAKWDYSGLDCLCDIHAFPVKDNRVQFVVCTQTLEHVTAPSQVISELHRILEPGGTIFCTLPFQGDPHHQEPYDFYRYTKYAVSFLFKSAGFHNIEVRPFGGYYTLLVYLFQHGLIRVLERRERMAFPIRALALYGVKVLSLVSRWANRLAWRWDQRDPERYRFALGFAVTASK